MKSTFVILPGLALVVFMAGTAFHDTGESDELAAELARLDQYTIPVGGVILWWGTLKEIPENFEICDGRAAKTRGATLQHRKPELRDRFPMGAPNEFRFRPSRTNEGGGKDPVSKPTFLTVDQLPSHKHEMEQHEHPIGPNGHAHTLPDKPSHTHPILGDKGHTHSIPKHRHPLPEFAGFEEINVNITGEPPTAVVRHFIVKSASAGHENVGMEVEKDRVTDSSGEHVTLGSGPLTTDGSTPPETGEQEPGDTKLTGSAQGHTHGVDADDLRPAFTQFLFIIRVK